MSKFLKGFKVELRPNNRQMTLFRMNCGSNRWAYNWALQKKKEAFDKKEKIPNNIELHRELNKLKGLTTATKRKLLKLGRVLRQFCLKW